MLDQCFFPAIAAKKLFPCVKEAGPMKHIQFLFHFMQRFHDSYMKHKCYIRKVVNLFGT